MARIAFHLGPLAAIVLLLSAMGMMGLAQPRQRPDFRERLDSLRRKASPDGMLDDILKRNGHQERLNPIRNVGASQSQVYVIDTAIVRRLGNGADDPGDTTRHLYSFDVCAKRTLDLTQNLEGDLWMDSLRQSNTNDAEGRELTWVSECWSNGQWMRLEDRMCTYDHQGNWLTRLDREYHVGQLYHYDQDSSTYDSQGRPLFRLSESWTAGYGVVWARETYVYNAETNQESLLIEFRSGAEAWEPDWRTVTIRDTLGREISRVDWALDGGVVAPRLAFRQTWTYDSQGNILTSLSEDYYSLGPLWVMSSSYTHDTQGNMLTCIRAEWIDGVLVDSTRTTQTFDASGLFLSGVGETWRNGLWELAYRSTNSYDGQGNLLSRYTEGWSAGLLDSYWRSTCTYDGQGRMLSEVVESWGTGDLARSERSTYTYDAEGSLIEVWHHGWLGSSWIPLDFRKVWGDLFFSVIDSAGNRYSFDGYNITFARKLIVTGVVPGSWVAPGTYTLSQNYPNPFNPTTTIEYALPRAGHVSLRVYNVLGEEVATLVDGRHSAGDFRTTWDASGLPSGVYFYRLTAGDHVQVRRMILMR